MINFADAQQAMGFILPQQFRIEKEVYETRYPSFDYAGLMFVNTEGGMWDQGTVFFSGDIAGKAEWLSSRANDMPFADVSQTQFINENHMAGIGYEWSLGELKRAEQLGRNLPSNKARAASKVAEAFVYRMAIRGNTEKNKTGIVNDASVPTANVPADGTGSARTFASKDADKILRDVNEALYAVTNNTAEVHVANTLGLPTTVLQGIAGRRLGTNNETTILDFLKRSNAYTVETGQALKLFGSRELETAGASSTGRMIAYDNSREVVQFHLPGAHEFLPVFQRSAMTWQVDGIMNIGGVEIRLPKAMVYRDGV